jgi:hypothetical protein
LKLPILGGQVTTDFYEMRPLSGPKTHVHGAIDIAGGDKIFRSPIAGQMQAVAFIQQDRPIAWADRDKPLIMTQPARHYWYHIYGGIIQIKDEAGRTHLFTHFWLQQLRSLFHLDVLESSIDSRFAPVMLYSERRKVTKGEQLCPIGSAGVSTGPHIHWEVHPDGHIMPHASRINPEKYIEL